jgi:hypothetical protein
VLDAIAEPMRRIIDVVGPSGGLTSLQLPW